MERYCFDEKLQRSMEISRIPMAVYQFVGGRIVTLMLSDGFLDLFGYTDRARAFQEMDQDMYKDTHPDDRARIAEAAMRFAVDGGKYEVIYRTKNHYMDGYNVIHAIGEHVYTDTGIRLAYVWYMDEGTYAEGDDAIDLRLNQSMNYALYAESVIRQTRYDYLTGLPNMTYFLELIAVRKDELVKDGKAPAFLFTDFCGMKYFNQKYGFAEGDRLLLAFGRLLAEHFGNENCSRLGQDHFGVVMDDSQIEETMQWLFKACRSLNEGLNLPLHVGIHQYRLEAVNASTACDRAKLACDALKGTYANTYKYYDASMRDAEQRKQYILDNLDRAIEEGWIQAYYQPIVRAVNGRVCDEEALARWIDPVMGFLSPADFIPILEEARLIYKLDLYILDLVIKKIEELKKNKLHIVPQSINLSRSDFDTCDIVSEICRRVDAAGLPRRLFTIEITESIVGSELSFIRSQVEHFRECGFHVWMDDFGSGYSSLDVLQSIHFDLIKFDMRFMQKFDEGESGKIILTEMMRMASALGVDTVCEGVETEEQVQFLREVGCSKLQGYYYTKPIPIIKILERYEKGIQVGFENPKETQYFETIGGVNLYDLAVISQIDRDDKTLHGEETQKNQGFFNTLPMAILEFKDDRMRFARTNQSYRDFVKRFFNYTIGGGLIEMIDVSAANSPGLKELVGFYRQVDDNLENTGNRGFVNEHLPGNYIGHYFVRRMAENPVTGVKALAVAVLSVRDGKLGATYANIARALAADYFRLYYVDLESEDFIEYTSNVGDEELAIERHGGDFFRASRQDAMKILYREDRQNFVRQFTKEHVLEEMDRQGTFTISYRLMQNGEPFYVNMKAMRMQQDGRHIIIGVSNIDSQMKQKAILDKANQDRILYSRIMALSGDYISMYSVDLETEHYVEYNASDLYAELGLAKQGDRFFDKTLEFSDRVVYPDDLDSFKKKFSREQVLEEIGRTGVYKLDYRLVLEGKVRPITLRAAVVKENDRSVMIVGILMRENQHV